MEYKQGKGFWWTNVKKYIQPEEHAEEKGKIKLQDKRKVVKFPLTLLNLW